MDVNYLNQTFSHALAKNTSLLVDNSQYILLNARWGANVVNFLSFLKLSSLTRFSTLVELTAYDQPWNKRRFTLVYFFLSIETNKRLSVKFSIPESGVFHSIAGIFSNSTWSEREVRDMFGIYFQNNSDLRRLLTDYGFEGFPLRKDFPLSGYIEVRYDDETQMILYEPVELSQEFRLFISTSPWEKVT